MSDNEKLVVSYSDKNLILPGDPDHPTYSEPWEWDNIQEVSITSLALVDDKSAGYICKIDETDQ